MKKILITLIALFLLGCKPTETFVEKRVKVDSTALNNLTSTVNMLEQKHTRLQELFYQNQKKTDILKSNKNATVEYFDTSKSTNPILQRITYREDSSLESERQEYVQKLSTLDTEIAHLENRLNKISEEHKLLKNEFQKSKTKTSSLFHSKYFYITFFILLLLVVIWVKRTALFAIFRRKSRLFH